MLGTVFCKPMELARTANLTIRCSPSRYRRSTPHPIELEVMKISGQQATLFDLEEYARSDVVQWGWLDADPKLGTKDSLVPNPSLSRLGTKDLLVPNPPLPDTWSEKFNGVYLEQWKPIMGCLQQKWVKNCQYWYWRYYDNRGKKRSIYLCKDYSKAVRKVIKMGVPADAKPPNLPASDSPPTAETS